jgi:hypothetical protein
VSTRYTVKKKKDARYFLRLHCSLGVQEGERANTRKSEAEGESVETLNTAVHNPHAVFEIFSVGWLAFSSFYVQCAFESFSLFSASLRFLSTLWLGPSDFEGSITLPLGASLATE